MTGVSLRLSGCVCVLGLPNMCVQVALVALVALAGGARVERVARCGRAGGGRARVTVAARARTGQPAGPRRPARATAQERSPLLNHLRSTFF